MELNENTYDSSNREFEEEEKNNEKNNPKLKVNKQSSISTITTQFTSENEKTNTDFDNSKIIKQKIDSKNNRYPYCIVWTPLPCISWFLPFIGHTGICG